MLSFRPMSPARFDNSAPGSSPIQFGTAEYLGSPGADHCQFCQQPITGTYYRVHGAMACRGCAEKAQSELPQYSHADYLRGLLYGVDAATRSPPRCSPTRPYPWPRFPSGFTTQANTSKPNMPPSNSN